MPTSLRLLLITVAISFSAVTGCDSRSSAVTGCDSRSEKVLAQGRLAFQKGEYDKAIADATEAIRLNPKNVNASYDRGLVYGLKGEYDKAIADFTEVIRLKPQYAKAYCSRGAAYSQKCELDKAIADFTAHPTRPAIR